MTPEQLLVVIMGAPASGKSDFLQKLLQKGSKETTTIAAVSGDAIQKYIQVHHRLPALREALKHTFIDQYTLEKETFDEQTWRASREWVKEHAGYIVQTHGITFVEDDFLLRSQRKSFRRIAETHHCGYIELLMDSTLQECIEANSLRKQKLPEEVLIRSYHKMERESTYLIKLTRKQRQQVDFVWLSSHAFRLEKAEEIKHKVTMEDLQKNQAESSIRKFIGQLMRDEELATEYLGKISLKKRGDLLAKAKKSLGSHRSLQDFKKALSECIITYFNNGDEEIIHAPF